MLYIRQTEERIAKIFEQSYKMPRNIEEKAFHDFEKSSAVKEMLSNLSKLNVSLVPYRIKCKGVKHNQDFSTSLKELQYIGNHNAVDTYMNKFVEENKDGLFISAKSLRRAITYASTIAYNYIGSPVIVCNKNNTPLFEVLCSGINIYKFKFSKIVQKFAYYSRNIDRDEGIFVNNGDFDSAINVVANSDNLSKIMKAIPCINIACFDYTNTKISKEFIEFIVDKCSKSYLLIACISNKPHKPLFKSSIKALGFEYICSDSDFDLYAYADNPLSKCIYEYIINSGVLSSEEDTKKENEEQIPLYSIVFENAGIVDGKIVNVVKTTYSHNRIIYMIEGDIAEESHIRLGVGEGFIYEDFTSMYPEVPVNEIYDVYVSPAVRNKGIATILMNAVINDPANKKKVLLLAAGASKLEYIEEPSEDTMIKVTESLRPFYTKLGFSDVNKWLAGYEFKNAYMYTGNMIGREIYDRFLYMDSHAGRLPDKPLDPSLYLSNL